MFYAYDRRFTGGRKRPKKQELVPPESNSLRIRAVTAEDPRRRGTESPSFGSNLALRRPQLMVHHRGGKI